MLVAIGALIPILVIPIVPILGIAAYLNIKLQKLTGNIWLAGLVNALLITMITVANTSGNEIVAKKDYFASLPKEIVGPYHAKSILFEKFAPQIKFGTVKISKLKQGE